jgi:predicted  nucleic acid-binding Zn-ribbon protein
VTDQIAELQALADQLRATIAELDERIEARAQQIAAERPAVGDARDHFDEAMNQIELAGEAWRQDMMRRVPEGADHVAGISAATFTSSAAQLLHEICSEAYNNQKRGGEVRDRGE